MPRPRADRYFGPLLFARLPASNLGLLPFAKASSDLLSEPTFADVSAGNATRVRLKHLASLFFAVTEAEVVPGSRAKLLTAIAAINGAFAHDSIYMLNTVSAIKTAALLLCGRLRLKTFPPSDGLLKGLVNNYQLLGIADRSGVRSP